MSDIQIQNTLDDLALELKRSVKPPVFVGYSGGVDSTLLLALACRVFQPCNVTAIHVNHNLSVQAQGWQDHCVEQTRVLDCHCLTRSVSIENQGKGLESEARDQRYRVFADLVGEGQTLLLGHHLDDQVETFFLRLLRGAGPHGLQGMASSMNRDGYQIQRPLLTTSRSDIERMAELLELTWIEDDSNSDLTFDRNYLRQHILPGIESRWPAYRQRILQTQRMLSDEASSEESFNVADALTHRLSHDQGLKMVQLDDLSRSQTLTLIHHWLVTLGRQVPSRARLATILDEVVPARVDARPSVRLDSGTVQRHGPALYWVADLPDPGPPPEISLNETLHWPGVGSLQLRTVTEGPRLSSDLTTLSFRLRSGGEVLRPVGRSKSRDLKRLFQEYRIKPWLRDRMPLLYSGDELVAVGDELLSADHLAGEGAPGLVLHWQKSD